MTEGWSERATASLGYAIPPSSLDTQLFRGCPQGVLFRFDFTLSLVKNSINGLCEILGFSRRGNEQLSFPLCPCPCPWSLCLDSLASRKCKTLLSLPQAMARSLILSNGKSCRGSSKSPLPSSLSCNLPGSDTRIVEHFSHIVPRAIFLAINAER